MSKRRVVRILDQTEIYGTYEKILRIDGLKCTHVSCFESYNDPDVCYMRWYCHENTKEVINVITSILGCKTGFETSNPSKCDRILESLISAFEVLGHKVVYEKVDE